MERSKHQILVNPRPFSDIVSGKKRKEKHSSSSSYCGYDEQNHHNGMKNDMDCFISESKYIAVQ